MASISPKRAAKARKIRNKLRTEIVEQYAAQRAGRDDAPKWDASHRPDSLNYIPLIIEQKEEKR